MIVTNKLTGKDVSGLYLQLMQGKITKTEFEKLSDYKQEPATSKQLWKIAMVITDKYPIIKDEIAGDSHFSSHSANNAIANFFKTLSKDQAMQLIGELERGDIANVEETINELTAKINVK